MSLRAAVVLPLVLALGCGHSEDVWQAQLAKFAALQKKDNDLAAQLAAEQGRRKVYVDAARGWREVPVYRREALPSGARIDGPAVVNEMSATTVLLPGQSGRVDEWGNLILEVAP